MKIPVLLDIIEFFGGIVTVWKKSRNIIRWRPVYGAYIEHHLLPGGRRSRYQSIVVVAPKMTFLGIPLGVKIFGLCVDRRKRAIRDFSSMTVELQHAEPLILTYEFKYNYRDEEVRINSGFVRLHNNIGGCYTTANGWFRVIECPTSSRRRTELRIAFDWQRIPPDKIIAALGRKRLNNHADIVRFLDSDL